MAGDCGGDGYQGEGDTGLKEIDTIGMPSRADNNDIERGLKEILSIIKASDIETRRLLKPKKRKAKNFRSEEEFFDIEEFDE